MRVFGTDLAAVAVLVRSDRRVHGIGVAPEHVLDESVSIDRIIDRLTNEFVIELRHRGVHAQEHDIDRVGALDPRNACHPYGALGRDVGDDVHFPV